MSSKARPLTPLSIDPEKVCILARLEVKVPEVSGRMIRKHAMAPVDPVFPQLAGRNLLPSCQFHAVQYGTGLKDEHGVRVTTINGTAHSANLLMPSVIGHLERLARLGIDGKVRVYFPSMEAGAKWRALIQPGTTRDTGKKSVEFESIGALLMHAAELAADMEALGARHFATPTNAAT
ncbi:MAG: hypothetical protein AAB671_01655 [Patescibacteria group bacterium]